MSEPKPKKTAPKEVSSKEVKKTDSGKTTETKQETTTTKKAEPNKSASQSSISHFSSVSTPAYRSGWEKIFGNKSKSEASKEFSSKTNPELPNEISITNNHIDTNLRVLLQKTLELKAKEQGVNLIDEETLNSVEYHVKSKKFIDGYFSPIGGSLQPAVLVRGLKKIAENNGIKIFEKSTVISYNHKKEIHVKTNNGSVTCEKLVFAINAWTPNFLPFLSRSVVLVSSDMIITEPIQNELQNLGLNNGLVILDSNLFTHYSRTTPDGKIILGKGGNTFSFRNKVISSFDGPSTIEKFLKKSLVSFYPSLKESKITTSWNGPSDRTKTGFPFFGYHPKNKNIAYAFGYSGNGVLTCHVGGEILSSMTLHENNKWTDSNFCKGPLKNFPPEPFRWLGAMIIRSAVQRKENAQEKEINPKWIDKQLAKLAASVGRVDLKKNKN